MVIPEPDVKDTKAPSGTVSRSMTAEPEDGTLRLVSSTQSPSSGS
jgi:hypothetical protein